MKKLIYTALFSALVLFSACKDKTGGNTGGTDTTKTDTTVQVPQPVTPEFNSPEGVASDGQFLYVSNVGVKLEPTVKDGDGRIMKLNMDATDWLEKDKWSALKLDAPKGMVIVGSDLYVTDIDRVVVINRDNATQTHVYDFSQFEATFLNDIAQKDDSTLIVSATDLNAIFKINLKTKTVAKMKTGELIGPNGLTYQSEGNKIYCVEYGKDEKNKGRVVAIDGNTGIVKQVGKHKGGLDGVAFSANGSLIFSDWDKGHLQKMDINTGAVTEVPSDSIKGPADFYYHIPTRKAYVPRMQENSMIILDIE